MSTMPPAIGGGVISNEQELSFLLFVCNSVSVVVIVVVTFFISFIIPFIF